MKAITKRRLLDMAIYAATTSTLLYAGAGWWAFVIFPLSLWNYYDGKTRENLK